MSTPASALPRAMQHRLAELKAASADPSTPPASDPPSDPATPPVSPPTAVSPPTPPSPVEGERVTLTRAEYDALQANAGRSTTAEGRAEMLRLQLEEQAHRLTELENSSKSGATTAKPPAGSPADSFDNIDISGISFTEDENKEYGESREFIQKVVRLEVAGILKDILPKISTALNETKRTAEGLATNVAKTEANSFRSELVKKVGRPLEQVFNHKHWEAYLDEVEPLTQYPMSALLTNAVNNKNVEAAANIYTRYVEKYMTGGDPNADAKAAYAGAAPGGGGDGAGNNPPAAASAKLKLSDRKKANEDYRKGRITYAQLEEVNKKFLEADKAGNVDYTA